MGSYNPDTPNIIGIETPLYSMRTVLLNNPGKAVAMQIRPGVVSANELHTFLSDVAGQPGLALELVQILNPTVSSRIFVPGTDSDSVVTGFQDQAGGTVNFGDIDDRYDAANYARNAAKIPSSTTYPLLFASDAAGALAGKRITAVYTGASATMRRISGNGSVGYLAPALSIDTVQYFGSEKSFGKNDRMTFFDRLGTWYFDPSTGLPWTVTRVNGFLDTTDNELYGVRLRAQAAAQGIRIHGLYFEVDNCTENRFWFAYMNQQPRRGWHENAMTSLLGAMQANAWYWLVMSCPFSTASSWAKLPLLIGDPVTPLAPDAASSVGEHRRVMELSLPTPAGVPTTVPNSAPGFIPALVGNSSTINDTSQAYAEVDSVLVYGTGPANIGQQLYAPAGGPHACAGVGIEVSWGGTDIPDAPLVIQVRSGAGAISGGGSLLATATLYPSQLSARVQYIRVPFDGGGVSLASTTQYHVLVNSSASYLRPWVVFRGDSRSDFLQASPTTTLNEVEQQTFGRAGGTGQDDAYCEAGSAFARYDLIIQLLKAPTAPTNFAATTVPAKTIERGVTDMCDPTVREPMIVLTWTPSALGASFRAYIVQRRLRATPVPQWETVYERRPSSSETPAVVELNEWMFIDSCAGWSVTDSSNIDGWDYRLMVEDKYGLRSLAAAQVTVGVKPPGTDDSWMVSNKAWWLRSPLRVHGEMSGGGADAQEVWAPLGRDGAVIRTPVHLPIRTYRLTWTDLDYSIEARLAAVREASLAGQKMALLEARGDRLMGSPTTATRRRTDNRETEYTCDFTLAGRPVSDPVAGYNGPCEIMFDASTAYALTGNDASLNPGSSPFAVAICGHFAYANGAYLLSKGNLGTGDGYAIRCTAVANQIEVIVDGASSAVSKAAVVAELFNGILPHVVWLVYDGALLSLYIDDEASARVSQAGAAGAITNTVGLAVAANNGGASGRAGGQVRSWAYWPAVPTQAQRQMSARYMLGCYGQRVHVGASLFIDAADDRSWSTPQTGLRSLAGAITELSAALTGSWTRRGVPAPLSRLERWYAH